MKFLVCYEEADPSALILKEALAHAKAWNASLEIVNTVTRELPLKRERILEMEQELEASVKSQIEAENVNYNTQLVVTQQESGEKLVAFADEQDCDLIFLGIIKRSKVGKLLFGSTAQYVILNAPCPVVTVKV